MLCFIGYSSGCYHSQKLIIMGFTHFCYPLISKTLNITCISIKNPSFQILLCVKRLRNTLEIDHFHLIISFLMDFLLYLCFFYFKQKKTLIYDVLVISLCTLTKYLCDGKRLSNIVFCARDDDFR